MPVGFTDAPAPEGPPEGWTNLVANDNAYFIRQSYGAFRIGRFAVCPPVNMGVSSTNYAPFSGVNWMTSAFLPDVRAKARLAGYDTDNYDLEIVHTYLVNEPKVGNASTGGKGVWINMSNRYERISFVTAHEVGHNLGAFHSQGFSSSSYIYVSKTGYWLADYGNPFDRMGFGTGAGTEFCAYTKNAFGWLPDHMVADAATSGTYRIYAFDQGSVSAGQHYAMRITRDQANVLWFEFRQAVTNNPWSMNGLHVLRGAENVLSSAGAPRLLDMTPGSSGGLYPDPVWGTGGATLFDAPLLLGRTFSDVNAAVHVTPLRKAGTSPEALDVVVNHGPFPGNRQPVGSLSASTLTPLTNQVVTFTATASDPDGDPLAYFWEFDDPDAPAGSGIRPFGMGALDPDATLRTVAVNAWASNGLYLARCTATDMKGGRTTFSAVVTVGDGSGLTITGVVKDQAGNPVSGAVVNNWNLGSPAVAFGSTNFVASGETASNGSYMIHVRGNTTYNLMAHFGGHAFLCNKPGNSTTGSVSVGAASVTNVNFTRVTNLCTIGGTVNLEGGYPPYDPALHGPVIVRDGNPAHDATVDATGNWRMTLPEGPVTLTITTPPGCSARYGFPNPYEVMDNYTILSYMLDVPGAVASVGFGSRGDACAETAGSVDIPVVLTLPDGYTNSTWPAAMWLKGEVDADSTAQYGVDYRMYGMEQRFTNFTAGFTNHITLNVISNGASRSRTVVLNLVPLTSLGHMGMITSCTYAIIVPGADDDVDGMPDWWEWQYSRTLTNMAPASDADGDGVCNLDEYRADTDPGSTNSFLAITDIHALPGSVHLNWRGGSNAWQYLECRTSLVDTSDEWEVVFTNAPVTTLITNCLQNGSTNASRFYRVRAHR